MKKNRSVRPRLFVWLIASCFAAPSVFRSDNGDELSSSQEDVLRERLRRDAEIDALVEEARRKRKTDPASSTPETSRQP